MGVFFSELLQPAAVLWCFDVPDVLGPEEVDNMVDIC